MAPETSQIITSLFFGLIEGSLYGLLGVGLSLALGVMKIVNLAHGPLAVLGAYVLFFLVDSLSIPVPLSFLFSLATLVTIGLIIYWGLIDRIVTNESSTLIVTYGLEIIIGNMLLSTFTGATRTVDLKLGSLNLGCFSIGLNRILALFIALTSILAIDFISRKTFFGIAMRATADDKDAAELMGIKTSKVYALSYSICTLLACLFGLCYITTHCVTPLIGGLFTLKAFVVTVLCGGNLILALVIGLLLGLSEVLLTSFLIPSPYQNSVAFVILLIALTTLRRKRR